MAAPARNVPLVEATKRDKMVVTRKFHTAKIMNALNATSTPWETLSVVLAIDNATKASAVHHLIRAPTSTPA